jgi:biotin carboxyl carrier protein
VRVVASQAAAPGGGGPRIVATRSPVAEASASGQGGHAAHPAHAAHVDQHAADATSTTHGVTAPAVGFFAYADGLGPGLAVEKGDALGHVEMLGVRHDVRAPRRGLVRHLVIEAGEPVEYGQVLVELEPSE